MRRFEAIAARRPQGGRMDMLDEYAFRLRFLRFVEFRAGRFP
jgi:hypothetical protein